MGTITLTLPSDGQTIDAADVNTPFNTIATVINGNIDSNNVTAGGLTPANLVSGTGTSWVTTTIAPTKVGWTSTTINVWQYIQMGKMVWLYFDVSGTSNATTTTVTLPVAARSLSALNRFEGSYGLAVDNGTVKTGQRWGIDLTASATVCNFFPDYPGSAWTNSGTKAIRGFIIYESA